MKKTTKSGFAGIASAALLAVVGLAPTANAQLNFSPGYTGGSFILKYNNFDMGTVYNPDGTIQSTPLGSDPLGSEDSWGVGIVTSILDSVTAATIWSSATSGQELTVMFYGAEDFDVSFTGTTQTTSSTGLKVDLWLQDIAGGYTAYDPSMGSAGRTALDRYTSVTDGLLLLQTVSTAGFLNLAPGGAATEYTSTFTPGSGGLGSTYLNVVGGAMASFFDTNSRVSAFDPTLRSDLFAQFTTSTDAADLVSDWLVSSNDPVRGVIVPVPEPSTYGLMAAGALLGLVAFRRMKVRAQAV